MVASVIDCDNSVTTVHKVSIVSFEMSRYDVTLAALPPRAGNRPKKTCTMRGWIADDAW